MTIQKGRVADVVVLVHGHCGDQVDCLAIHPYYQNWKGHDGTENASVRL
jgi:prophage tail gpP-like protein